MTAVSAPGKVLLAGGYLVLDRAYTALVFGLSARIHVLVRDREASTAEDPRPEIVVQSPQFRDASWTYSYQVKTEDGGVDVIQLPGYEGAVALSFLRLTPLCLSAVSVPLFLPTSFTRWIFLDMVTCRLCPSPFSSRTSSESGRLQLPRISLYPDAPLLT
jgi:hypothetical protein